MNSEVLIPGLKFINEHKLTPKEVEILIYFLEKPYITSELAEKLEMDSRTLHQLIQRLKLKNVLVLKSRDANRNNLYEFDKSIIED